MSIINPHKDDKILHGRNLRQIYVTVPHGGKGDRETVANRKPYGISRFYVDEEVCHEFTQRAVTRNS